MPAPTKINPVDLDLIVDRLNEGRCVPFLGAAANVSSKARKYKGLPLGVDLANKLIRRISFKGRDPQNLSRVALEYEFSRDRADLIASVRTILPEQTCAPSPLLRILASLPFKLIITTNYDRLLERALKDEGKIEGKHFDVVIQPPGGFDDTPETNQKFERLEERNRLIVYKIHGTFLDKPAGVLAEDKSQIIITEDDYIEFLTVVGRQEERIGVPKLIEKRMAPSTLLFLGYSLEDWDFRTIYKGIIEKLNKHHKRRSYAIQKRPSEFWVNFWSKEEKRVEIYDLDLYEFAERLQKAYRAKYRKGKKRAKKVRT